MNVLSNTVLVAWYIGGSVILVVLLGLLSLALMRLNARLEQLSQQLDPIVSRAEILLDRSNEKLETVGNATESLLHRTEAVAALVEAKTDTASTAIQRAVYTPFVGVNALLQAVSTGVSTFGRLQKDQLTEGKKG